MTGAARLFDRRTANEPVLGIPVAVILLGIVGELQAWRRCMGIGAGPEAQLNSLLAARARMVNESDVQFLLYPRVEVTMPLCEAEQGLVCGFRPIVNARIGGS
jgi:hypothetical protein